jgi:hypothetical protein
MWGWVISPVHKKNDGSSCFQIPECEKIWYTFLLSELEVFQGHIGIVLIDLKKSKVVKSKSEFYCVGVFDIE